MSSSPDEDDQPHEAAINDGEWKTFKNRKAARDWVAKQIKKPSDSAWVRPKAN